MAILTDGKYYSGAYLTGDYMQSSKYTNKFNFPLGMQEKNLAIYETVGLQNVEKYGEYMFKQKLAGSAPAFNLKIETFLNGTKQDDIVTENNITIGIHSFTGGTRYSFNKIRIGANDSAHPSFAIFNLENELSGGTRLGITVTVTKVTQGGFIFGKVMIVDRLEEFVPFQPSLTDGGYENYLEIEPFKIQGKYGPKILIEPDGAIKNNLIDVEVIPTNFNGTMTVYSSDGFKDDMNNNFTVDISFNSPNQLTCASINQMFSKALIDKYGFSSADEKIKYFNKICWKEFSLKCDINCYYHNTKDIITTYKNGRLTAWKLTGQTFTLTGATNGGPLYNLFYLRYDTETASLKLNNVSTKFNITGATVGDYVVIPNLKKHKLYLGEAANSRYQCLFGENSIDGILNYYTEQGTYRLPYSSINNSNASLNLYVVSGGIGVDYKIIPCGLNYENDMGDIIACNQLSLSTNQLQIYSLSNNYFKTSGAVRITMAFNNAYSAYGTSDASQQVVYVYLFDEDEFGSYTDTTSYNDVVEPYLRHSFIPTTPDTLTESTGDTLSGITNGLLKNIRFGVKSQGDSNNVNSPYIDFGEGTIPSYPGEHGYDTLITVLDFSLHLSDKELQSDSIQKENFTFTSCESIFFDGIPHPCNKDYYLTGNIVMLPAYNREYFSKYFFLFIGARRITQEILNKTIGYYGQIDFTCDYFSYQGSSANYWVNYTPNFNLRDINETDFRISNKIASIEDLNKKVFSYYAPSLIYGGKWSSAYENTYNGYFKYFNAHMFNPKNEFLGYITSSGGLGVEYNLKVRGVKLFNFVDDNTDSIEWVYENERDIKPMIYPVYYREFNNEMWPEESICISEPSNTNIIYTYCLGPVGYQAFLSAWTAYNHNPTIYHNFDALILYNDGTYIDGINIDPFVGVSVAEWNYNSGNVGLYPSGGIGECIGQMNIHVPGNVYDEYTPSTTYGNTFNVLFSNDDYHLWSSTPRFTISNFDNLPTINDAFRDKQKDKYAGCTILIKFDFNKQLYYMDVSFSLTIPTIYSIKKNVFMENFKAFIEFRESLTISINPLGDDKELLNTFELNDNSAIISFKIYETNKVPFNVNGKDMFLCIDYNMLDLDGKILYTGATFTVSSCLIHSDTSYQNWLFHYEPCEDNTDIAFGYSPYLESGCTLTTGPFVDPEHGLKLEDKSIYGSVNKYAARWDVGEHGVINSDNSPGAYTGTCIVSSAVIIPTVPLDTTKFAIPFNFNTSVFPLVPTFELNTSNAVGEWYLLHYSQNINDGNYVYSIYDGISTNIITGTTYNKNIYNDALNSNNDASIYVGFRPSCFDEPINDVEYDPGRYYLHDAELWYPTYQVTATTITSDLGSFNNPNFAIWLLEPENAMPLTSSTIDTGKKTHNLTIKLNEQQIGDIKAGRELYCGFIPNTGFSGNLAYNYVSGSWCVKIEIPNGILTKLIGKEVTMTVETYYESPPHPIYRFTIKSFTTQKCDDPDSNPYLLYGINIKYVDMSYLNDITHNNLYF